MPIVKVQPHKDVCPNGAEIDVETGKRLAQALNQAGVSLPHSCQYNCACASCHVIVKEGYDTLGTPDDDEYDQLECAVDVCPTSRLACQVRMGIENITIEIPKKK